jgi:5-methylthioribose kinase
MAYDTYFLMGASDAEDYAKTKLDFFTKDASLECQEIGDGNLNYIFRIEDTNSGKSLVIKQAGDTARISDEFKVSPDRNRIEYEILKIQNDLAPGLVPEVYNYDEVMNCLAMEDLTGHRIMRHALVDHEQFPRFADDITTFIVNTQLLTSDIVMNPKDKKRQVGNFINPDLCEITEELIFTEPFNDIHQRNAVFPPNKEFVERELYGDSELRRETAKLKLAFMSSGQSLIHGDLHTGSIFVKPDSTKVIDPEFAFYGPAGFDLGMIVANLIFAWANAHAVMDDSTARTRQTEYLEQSVNDILQLFQQKWNTLWDEKATETVASYEGVKEWYLEQLLADASGVAGLELCRRIVGLAQVKDITSIEEPDLRLSAERSCLSLAKRLIMDRHAVRDGRDYLGPLHEAAHTHALI